MTETTNPLPSDPGGATAATPQESTLGDGSDQLLGGGSTGIPANLAGVDKRGDEAPTATGDPSDEQTGVSSELPASRGGR